MIAPAFLTNPEVRRWLNGVEPAWTVLAFDSFNSLCLEPSAHNPAIRLEHNLITTDLSESAITRNTLVLLHQAIDTDGLKLTATGNLTRAVVAELCRIIEWPDYDKQELFRSHKVINEPDFLPLHLVRVLTQATKLFRPYRGKLMPTRLGREMLAEDRQGALQAVLFHIALWHLDLACFDPDPIGSWPQDEAGVVLWSLSTAASVWLNRETLTRLCTVPINSIVESHWDLGSSAMEARILRPLRWFGLLERRPETRIGPTERHLYRKTPLFDKFLKFNVQIDGQDLRH